MHPYNLVTAISYTIEERSLHGQVADNTIRLIRPMVARSLHREVADGTIRLIRRPIEERPLPRQVTDDIILLGS